jgi:predicted phosphodiesterase
MPSDPEELTIGLEEDFLKAEAEATGKDPKLLAVEKAVEDAHSSGLDFRVERGQVFVGGDHRDNEYVLDLESKDEMVIAIASDTHFGSKYEQLSALEHFCEEAVKRGADAFLHAGDLVQGTPKMHRGMEHEVHIHSADGQTRYAAEKLPETGKPWYIITGNHDDSWINESGTNVVRQVAALRDDVTYIGQDSCYLTVNGLRCYIVHPDGGVSYAKSYKPQKITEAIPIRSKTQLALIGHYHTYGSFVIQSTHALMLPCFQGQYPWLVRKALYPTIGGLILHLRFDEERIVEFTHTLITYDEIKNDWDFEASHRLDNIGGPISDLLPELS